MEECLLRERRCGEIKDAGTFQNVVVFKILAGLHAYPVEYLRFGADAYGLVGIKFPSRAGAVPVEFFRHQGIAF